VRRAKAGPGNDINARVTGISEGANVEPCQSGSIWANPATRSKRPLAPFARPAPEALFQVENLGRGAPSDLVQWGLRDFGSPGKASDLLIAREM